MKSEPTSDQIEALKATFILFDRNRDGTITVDELRHAFKNLGQSPTDEELNTMVNWVDF